MVHVGATTEPTPVLDVTTPIAPAMSNDETVPEEQTQREPDNEEIDSNLRDLQVVKTVLEVVLLVARLIRLL